jgi:hypothetical protein
MIIARPHPTELFSLHASVGGIVVYLDVFAVKELAKGDPRRRKRFIATLGRGVEVLFSVANAAELSGPLGASFDKMRGFLDEIGPSWFPVEFDSQVVIGRERAGKDSTACCFDEELLKVFVASRINRHPKTEVLGLSADFFRLGAFMDWLAPQRDDIAARKAEMDRSLIKRIQEHRAKYEADSRWLDSTFPALQSFRADRPATFAYENLIRNLILEAKCNQLKAGDGMDLCQAVIGSAYASVATLDKHWKRRVEALPKPNGLAKVYCSPQLDAMVADIERNVQVLEKRAATTAWKLRPPAS